MLLQEVKSCPEGFPIAEYFFCRLASEFTVLIAVGAVQLISVAKIFSVAEEASASWRLIELTSIRNGDGHPY